MSDVTGKAFGILIGFIAICYIWKNPGASVDLVQVAIRQIVTFAGALG